MKLGEVASVVSGGTPSTRDLSNFIDGDIPWITPADLSGYSDQYIASGKRNITHKGLRFSSARILPKGTVLFSSRAPIGYIAIAANDVCTNQGFKNFVLKDNIFPKYAYWWLTYIKDLAISMGSGTTFSELSKTSAENLPFLFVPIKKQKEMVSRIESLFGRLDDVATVIEKAEKSLQQCKNSKLHNFFNGKAKVALSDICQTSSGGTPTRANSKYYGGDIPWVKCGDLRDGIITKTEEQITAEGLANSNTKILPKGTLLIAMYAGSTIGRLGILGIEACTNQAICALTTSEKIDAKYLFWYLMSIRNDLQSQAVGGVQLNINQSILRQTKVWLPPLEAQKEIVSRIESLFERLGNVTTVIEKVEQRLQYCKNPTLCNIFCEGTVQ